MEPTHKKRPDNINWPLMERLLGRTATEDDIVKMECQWAGQLGHEKCGWCLACNGPRWVEKKECKHPRKSVWSNS